MKRLFALLLITLVLGNSSNMSQAQADPIRDGQALAEELRSLQMVFLARLRRQ